MATAFHNIGEPKRLPLTAVLSAIPSYPRPAIERLVARMIEHLDDEDGDPDLEDDDPNGQCDEDGFNTGPAAVFLHGTSWVSGAGCPIGDGGE